MYFIFRGHLDLTVYILLIQKLYFIKKKTENKSGSVVFYQRANFQHEIPYVWSCTNTKKYDIYSRELCKISRYENIPDIVIFVQPHI
jgi:hypothetical protein